MHDQRLSAHRAVGTRECTRCDAKAAEPHTTGVENKTPDRRASFRYAQGLDGSDAFPHQNNAAREYRDEFARTGIQSETSHADPRNRTTDEGNQGLNSPFAASESSNLISQNRPRGSATTATQQVFTHPRSGRAGRSTPKPPLGGNRR